MIGKFVTSAVVLLTMLLASGCASVVVPQDYARETPKLDLSTYFNGKVDGWGMVQDRSGKVLRRMYVELDCKWNGNEGVLDESFQWSDGKTEKRVWKIRKQGDRYVGTAGDVVGEAQGEAAGNALQWRYTLRLPEDLGGYEMNMDDWMWMVDDKTLTNRTTMSKFGVKFAEITIFFRKR
ncbi:MAG: DUF3833 domain-containing protein [Betaproteobacteria bacterium]|nr:DUF3833 domain-containing protein [Betaproteobacteria bacterium]